MGCILAIVALGLVWLATGAILLAQGTRPVEAHGFRRRVSRPIVAVGEEIKVELELPPPMQLAEIPERDIVLLLDRSGSMGSGPASRLGKAIRAAQTFLDRCPERLRIGLVTFHHAAERAQPMGGAGEVRKALQGLRGEGGTAIDLAVDRGREEFLENGRPGVPKTLFLLSDGGSDLDTARGAVESLRQALPGIEVCAAALGTDVNRQLLAQLAGGDENVFEVKSDRDFDRLFAFLAHRLAGPGALGVAADEGTRAPRPFRLVDTHPVTTDVTPDSGPRATHLRWALPVLDAEPVLLAYSLVAECPGWHTVATDLKATWSMPDGTTQTTALPEGPRVLVLPPLLAWAWPILHPLVFLLTGERFCAGVGADAGSEVHETAASLPSPTLPAAIPAVESDSYRPEVGPTLVIGLGEVGEMALCRLRHRLDDRAVPEDRVVMRLVDLGVGRRPTRTFGGAAVRPEERLELACDFFPYLDGLRRQGLPATRAWIPWQDWLASTLPQTSTAEPDRRRARLAVLHAAHRFEVILRPAIRSIVDREGVVVVIGSVDDPVATGLVGEVIHLAAGTGARTTLLLVTGEEPVWRDRVALEREFARWALLRGDDVPSDRVEPPAIANRLIDRLIVMSAPSEPGGAPASAAEMLYALLAWRAIDNQVPTVATTSDRPIVCRAWLETAVWPEEHLWRWVRDRTLVRDIVVGTLGWVLEKSAAKPADEEMIDRWVSAFWSAAGTRRPAGPLVREAPALLQGRPAHSVLLGRLPHDAPLHEQVAFHRSERRRFFGYLEDWCRRFVEEERRNGRWGLPALEAALIRLEDNHRRLIAAAEDLLGHPALAELGRLGADLYTDQRLALESLRREVSARRSQWAGSRGSVATRLVTDLSQAERALGAVLSPESLKERAEAWADEYGVGLQTQLAFEVHVDQETGHGEITVWIGDRTTSPMEDPLGVLRSELEHYRGTVDDAWLAPTAVRRIADPRQAVRVGGRSAAVFPNVARCLDETDPLYAGVLTIEAVPLAEALGVVEHRERDLPFVWPEEANAQRLGNWLRQPPIQREPVSWSPRIVHFLREPQRLYTLLAELAIGRVERQGERWGLRRGNCWQPIAEVVPDATPGQALERFESMARQVVALGLSLDGEPLLESDGISWSADSVAAVLEVERHPAVTPATRAPGWATWRDVIQSLVLERAHAPEVFQRS